MQNIYINEAMDTVSIRSDYFIIIIIIGVITFPIASKRPVPVAAQYKALVCGHSPAEIVGSNPAGGMDVCLLWVLSDNSICDEPITRPGEYVVVCGLGTSRTRGPCPALGCRATGELPVNTFNEQWKQI